jgi:hypothetical protein
MTNFGQKVNLSQDVQSFQNCIPAARPSFKKIIPLKSLTVWGCGMNHQEAERVTNQAGVQNF